MNDNTMECFEQLQQTVDSILSGKTVLLAFSIFTVLSAVL